MWTLATIALIFTGVAISNGQNQGQHISMTVAPQNETVYPGTHVVFTCRISASTGISDSPLVQLEKVVGNPVDRATAKTELITTQTVISNLYKGLGRFSITRTTDQSDLVYQLTISGAQPEDSGVYVCVLPESNPQIYTSSYLRVYKPPAGVSFPGYNGSTVVEVTEDVVPHDLRCQVAHVMPIPDVKLSVDGRDITKSSLVESDVNFVCADIGTSGKTCPLHQDNNVNIIPREYRPFYTDDGKDLVCTSTMREFNRTVNSASVRLSVRFAPKITCTPPTVRVNETDVTLVCKVYAKPFIPNYNRTWIVTINGKNTSMTGDVDGEYKMLEVSDKSANPKQADFMLTINRVTERHFKYPYYLKVENEVGEMTASVRLNQYTAVPPGGTGSRVMSTSGWTILILMTSSILLCFRRLF